tara:strand:- start:1138 stop:1308 length:171 start_codon:yes stop_codon:yes gene_type:complete
MSQKNYLEENKRKQEAIKRENEFLKKEVMDKGVDRVSTAQNIQSNMERLVEDGDSK